MVKRTLTGSLAHLSPHAVLRLVAAAAPTGVLELTTAAGALHLEISRGQIAAPSDDELNHAGGVLAERDGTFRFEPCELRPPEGETIDVLALVDAAGRSRPIRMQFHFDELPAATTGQGVDQLPAAIHVLPRAQPENPLDDMLSELEATAPGELLLTQIGVVAADPRLWRGGLDAAWRRRGWQVRLLGGPTNVPLDGLDLMIVHHQLSVTRVGRHEEWLDLVRAAANAQPPVPTLWVGPLADGSWVYRLVEAGVQSILPPPAADHGETVVRFAVALETVVDRVLRSTVAGTERPYLGGVGELVDAVLHEAEPDQAVGALLQVAADTVTRGAVLAVEEVAVRCRAAFGYPLARGRSGLPRGVGLLERVIRSGTAVTTIEPDAAGAVELARVLGVSRLPAETAVIPLGPRFGVSGLLVVDLEGEPLPELGELVMVGSRLGGVIVQPSHSNAVVTAPSL